MHSRAKKRQLVTKPTAIAGLEIAGVVPPFDAKILMGPVIGRKLEFTWRDLLDISVLPSPASLAVAWLVLVANRSAVLSGGTTLGWQPNVK